MWLQSWGCPVDVKFLRKAFRDIWIPEMLADVAQRLRFQLNRASRIGKLTAAQVQYDRLFESSSIRELVKVTCSLAPNRRGSNSPRAFSTAVAIPIDCPYLPETALGLACFDT
ncbi:uncharacterized protein CPUR_08243 [Claviceps purpurea 20.1]|uniref:Uncharacterized protein n=1 Tax=Claviceps purpurea (strain 20.1) TaxID=1111077 RepID=M1W5V1_CLAP2|nr:uncharacterized protein CPUR_08243 [Claviceps purpurea 20.1]